MSINPANYCSSTPHSYGSLLEQRHQAAEQTAAQASIAPSAVIQPAPTTGVDIRV